MWSSYPSLLSSELNLSAPPALTDTIHVTSSYTVDAGDTLDFAGNPGFKLEIRHGASVTLNIDGTVNLDGGDRHLKVTGLLTSRSTNGDAHVDIGSTGSLIVTAQAAGAVAVGALMQSEGAVFANEGLMHVSSANGAATGISGTAPQDIFVTNTNTIQVEAATTAFGIWVVTSGSVTNTGSVSVAGARAIGIAIVSNIPHTATMTNTGRVEAVGLAQSGWAYGAELVGGDFTNTNYIHASSEGYAIGAQVSELDSLTNTGHITAASTNGGHSFGLLVETEFNGGTITNTGVVRGEYSLVSDDAGRRILGGVGPASNEVVINAGKLVGGVALGGGSDGISNTGRIVGDVDLGDGGDIFISNRGRIEGDIMGGLGNDYVLASRGDDTVFGDAQNDGLGGGDDELHGMKGSDTLFGGQGADTLIGGKGVDMLAGGSGDDVFKFMKLGDSTPLSGDFITDLTATDVIDLSHIDADINLGGDQAFHVVGAFTGAEGELTITYNSGSDQTLFQGDVDGDGSADLFIAAAGDQSGFANFVL